jgi:hypothetical protein
MKRRIASQRRAEQHEGESGNIKKKVEQHHKGEPNIVRRKTE